MRVIEHRVVLSESTKNVWLKNGQTPQKQYEQESIQNVIDPYDYERS